VRRQTLIAAHKGRLWEKECAAYEETLTGLLHRQAKRQHELRGFKWDEATEQQLNAVFDSTGASTGASTGQRQPVLAIGSGDRYSISSLPWASRTTT
jgi:hypothetical protein